MPDFPTATVQLIDERIDQSQLRPTKMGTVQDRESGTARAVVSFDGSSGLAQPVKCFETVVVDIGDRVGLIKFEGEWIIVGNYTGRSLGEALIGVNLSSQTDITSATFVDMPTSPTAVLVKQRDATQIAVLLGCSVFASDAVTDMEIGVNLASADGTISTDVAITDWGHVAGPGLMSMVVAGTTTALTLPGGQAYAIIGRWRKTAGGTLSMNGHGNIFIQAREVWT